MGIYSQAAGESFVGLLDTYSGAAVAYSLRRLATAYTGNFIKVRRSSDNAELDIGYNSLNQLDTVALLAHVGTGGSDNGFVTTWYDQSGNSNNALNTTASRQPQIVIAGVVIMDNGKPTIQHSSQWLTKAITLTQPLTTFYVRKTRSIGGTTVSLGLNTSGSQVYALINSGGTMRSYYGAYLQSSSENTNQGIWYSLGNGASSVIGENGSITTGNAGTVGANIISIGSVNGSFPAPVNSQEVILYAANKNSDRTGIETNQNDFYTIY